MRGLRILCKGTGCDGCHCHLSAPCNHCVDHVTDGPLSRVFKSHDPHHWSGRWVGVCYMQGCEKTYPLLLDGGGLIAVADDYLTPFILLEDHVQTHLEQIGE